MRKVLSFVLVLSLVLGSVGMAFAAPMSDVAGEDYEDAVNVLTELGVITGYTDGTYRPDNIVTRAEMAVIAVRALGLADYAVGTSNFKDMGGHWSNPYVAYATSLGVIAGYPDGTFRPDRTVSYDEAATMLVAALGYTPESLVGTWPANYVVKAKSLGILDGIKAGAVGANRGDIATMTFQTLDNAIGKTDKDGKWEAFNLGTPTAAKDDTMLERLGAETRGVTATNPEGTPFVVKENDVEDAVANIAEYVGAYVIAYENSDGKIIAIKEVKSTFLTGEFDAVAWTEFETDDRDYDNDVGSVTPEFFTNGEIDPSFTTITALRTYKIAADVSGKKIKDIYSISYWNIGQGEAKLYESGDLEDDNIAGHDFKLDDNDDIDLNSFALLGVNSLEDIAKDNVVYIYENNAGEVSRIEVGTEVVTGKVTRISAAVPPAQKITVGGKAYELADASTDTAKWNGLDLDDEVKFYLNYAGDVFSVKDVVSERDNYAMLLEVENYKGGLSAGNAMSAKLFLADGTTKVFEVDKDFADVGTLTDGNGNWGAPAPVSGGAMTTAVAIEYGLDDDGVIDYIKVVAFDSSGPGAPTEELTNKGYYNGKAVDDDAVIFTYEGTTTAHISDKDKYGVTTVANATGKEFAADYFMDSGKVVVMVSYGLGTADDDIFALVKDRAITSESGTDRQVTAFVDGKEVPYDITKSLYDEFGAGTKNYTTVYKLTLNTKNEITALVAASGTELLAGSDFGTPVTVTTFANNEASIGSIDYTVADDAVAYKIDGSKYKVVSATKANIEGKDVVLIDTTEDKVANIVLITN